MRIDSESLVGGYPALQMRKLVRTLNDRLYWDLKTVQNCQTQNYLQLDQRYLQLARNRLLLKPNITGFPGPHTVGRPNRQLAGWPNMFSPSRPTTLY
jgi:hypothetical protein